MDSSESIPLDQSIADLIAVKDRTDVFDVVVFGNGHHAEYQLPPSFNQWKYHNDEYGLYWKVGSGFGGAGGGVDDSIIAGYFWPYTGLQASMDEGPTTGFTSLGLFVCVYFLFLFLVPFSLRDCSGEQQWLRWEWSQKNVALASKVRYARVLSSFPHGTVVQVPSELRSLILEFWATMGLIVCALCDGWWWEKTA